MAQQQVNTNMVAYTNVQKNSHSPLAANHAKWMDLSFIIWLAKWLVIADL